MTLPRWSRRRLRWPSFLLNVQMVPVETLTDVRETLRSLNVRVGNIDNTTRGMAKTMAADREMLTQLAADLNAMAPVVGTLLDNYAAANAKIAELEGQAAADEVADLEAIRPVRDAFESVASKFRQEPEAPDVEPLPGDEQSENLPGDTDGDENPSS